MFQSSARSQLACRDVKPHIRIGADVMAVTTKPTQPRDTKTMVRELSAENNAESPLVQSLRRQVANAMLLYLNYKHYHWQTYGPLFRDLHKLFDRFADDVLDTLDPLAERVR